MPVMEVAESKDIEVLFFTDDVDEFAIQFLGEYKSIKFESIINYDMSDESDKKELKEEISRYETDLAELHQYLGDKVSEVTLTNNISNTLATIVNKENISIEQEKILENNPVNDIKLDKILKLNPKHEMFDKLMKSDDKKDLIKLIYYQTKLQEGLKIENLREFNDLIYKFIK